MADKNYVVPVENGAIVFDNKYPEILLPDGNRIRLGYTGALSIYEWWKHKANAERIGQYFDDIADGYEQPVWGDKVSLTELDYEIDAIANYLTSYEEDSDIGCESRFRSVRSAVAEYVRRNKK